MSKNIAALTKRKGIDSNLLQRVTQAKSEQQKRQLAKEFLIGDAIVQGTRSFYDFAEGDNADKQAYLCSGSSCLCAQTQNKARQQLQQHFEPQQIGEVACLGRCYTNSAFQLGGTNYSNKDIQHLPKIITQQYDSEDAMPVYALCSDPILTPPIDDISHYYALFEQLIQTCDREQLLDKMVQSQLRGRGGAGFPAGIKWQACQQTKGEQKYIVCNADEGDPGAFSDRYLLEQQPHKVLFGMLVAGYLVGSDTGILYIRDEYPEAIDLCAEAIEEFEQLSLSYDFQFKIIRGAGAYICGEETALLRSIEGQRPVVSTRPPYPVEQGLFNQPTVVNNVETFASVHWILLQGPDAFAQRGKGRSTGTKLLSLDSAFNKPGIYEIEMGMPLAELITAAGGFARPTKALHIGGPLGGVVPTWKTHDLTLDFESFEQQGFLLGHASIIGLPESMPLIEYMAHLFKFTADESCGKCFPCRLGATRGHEMIQAAISKTKAIDYPLLEDLIETMELGSLCALGGGVPLPIKNILEHFSEELVDYIHLPQKDASIKIQEVC